jgi:hypothetical protein
MKTQDFNMIKHYYEILTNKTCPLNEIPISAIDGVILEIIEKLFSII